MLGDITQSPSCPSSTFFRFGNDWLEVTPKITDSKRKKYIHGFSKPKNFCGARHGDACL
jgi:hypothetical protein